MSHHLSVDFAVLQPGKEPASKKLQKKVSPSGSAKKRELKKMDIDNKQMEWRLHQLKQTMEKQKEERGKQGYIWRSGKNISLDSHSRNVLGRTVHTTSNKSPSAPKKNKPRQKVTILKDEPLDLPKRKSHSKELTETLMKNDPLLVNNHKEEPTLGADNEKWISVALDRSHNEIMEIQSDKEGNLPIESLHGVEPSAVGLYFIRWSRKRLLPAVDGKVMMPKNGWGSEVYYPYVTNSSPAKAVTPTPPPSFTLHKTSPKVSVRRARKSAEVMTGGKLLQGQFDEDESAQSFQDALKQWRTTEDNKISVVTSPHDEKPAVQMAVHAVQSDPVQIDVKFSETSTLTFMERVLLKKHRSTEIPPLPNLTSFDGQTNGLIDTLSEEDMEEQDRIRQIFSSTPGRLESRNSTSTIDVEDQMCVITEVPDIEVLHDSWMEPSNIDDVCYVDEGSDSDHPIPQSLSRITIEEVKFDEYRSQNETTAKQVPETKNKSRPNGDRTPIKSPKTSNKENISELNSENRIFNLNTKTLCETSPKVLTPKRPTVKKTLVIQRIRRGQVRPNSGEKKLMEGKDFENKDTSDVHELVKLVGKLPINPDAFYTKNLAQFFGEGIIKAAETEDASFFPDGDSCLTGVGRAWNPLSSIADNIGGGGLVPEVNGEKSEDLSRMENSGQHLQEDIERETADAETLNQLEWELASQTGNITSDGRISRLIEEWSSDEEELGIINDPGFGSGLSTPEVESIEAAMSIHPQWEQDDEMNRDFQQMENFMMDDLNSDTDTEL